MKATKLSQNTEKKEPVMIDTKGRGLKALKGQIFSDRFYVGKAIDEGANGKIFDCQDL